MNITIDSTKTDSEGISLIQSVIKCLAFAEQEARKYVPKPKINFIQWRIQDEDETTLEVCLRSEETNHSLVFNFKRVSSLEIIVKHGNNIIAQGDLVRSIIQFLAGKVPK